MSKKVLTISPKTSFEEIVKVLVKNKISGVPVMDKNQKIVGIVSEKDLFHKLFPSQKAFYKDPEYFMNFDRLENDAKAVLSIKAKKIMSKKVIYVEPDDHILKAVSLFVMHNIRRLPVLNKGRIVGIVTTNNIYRNFLMHITK